MAKRGFTAQSRSREPLNAVTAVPRLRKFMLKLFDREDGKAADWPMIAETLLTEAFYALDQSSGDPRIYGLLRRIEVGVYNRLVDNAAEAAGPSHAPAGDAISGQALRPRHDDAPKI